MLTGIDVSSYQPTNYATAGLAFVFIKVTEGLTYTNPKWTAQRDTARGAGLVTGFYHYPHIANAPAAEADYFLAQIGSALQPGDILCLDWEWYGQSVTDQQARTYKGAFLNRLKQQAPAHKAILYSDVSNWTTVDTDSYCADGLWIATAGRPPGLPGIQHQWVIQQYTDTGPDGADGDVANPALFPTAAALRAWATGTPPARTQEDDMPQWTNAPIAPSPDPTVVLIPAGTAWSAYPKRTLHLGMDSFAAAAEAQVRIAIHNGTKWTVISTVTVTAAGGTVDVDVTGMEKVSLQTDTKGVSYAVETW